MLTIITGNFNKRPRCTNILECDLPPFRFIPYLADAVIGLGRCGEQHQCECKSFHILVPTKMGPSVREVRENRTPTMGPQALNNL